MADVPNPQEELDYAPGEPGQPAQPNGAGGRGGRGGISRRASAAPAAQSTTNEDSMVLEAGKYFLSGHKPNSIMGGRKGAQRLCNLRTDASRQVPSAIEKLMSGLNLISNSHPGVQSSLPNKQAIMTLQKQLGVKPDGLFGPKTFRAVVARQYPHLAGKLPQAAAHGAGAPVAGQDGPQPAAVASSGAGYLPLGGDAIAHAANQSRPTGYVPLGGSAF